MFLLCWNKPGVDEYDPDYAQVQQMVRDALHPATATEEPAP